jgi:hypothetical protein
MGVAGEAGFYAAVFQRQRPCPSAVCRFVLDKTGQMILMITFTVYTSAEFFNRFYNFFLQP